MDALFVHPHTIRPLIPLKDNHAFWIRQFPVVCSSIGRIVGCQKLHCANPRESRYRRTSQSTRVLFSATCHKQGNPVTAQTRDDRKFSKSKCLLAIGLVATGIILVGLRRGFLAGLDVKQLISVQAQSGLVAYTPEGLLKFSVKLPGVNLSLGEHTPGWAYFCLLMAAGFGLFVSEEALNVWVGASLARSLAFDSREALLSSFSSNAPYIISTIFWVYWGVCVSDMVPFYAGKMASKTGDQICEKLGVNKKEYERVTATVQRYGNLIGFVERFSLGVRNPTSFLAGVAGISPARYFAGVCVGAMITLPMQISVGFLFRDRPVTALAGVAAIVVGISLTLNYTGACKLKISNPWQKPNEIISHGSCFAYKNRFCF